MINRVTHIGNGHRPDDTRHEFIPYKKILNIVHLSKKITKQQKLLFFIHYEKDKVHKVNII